MEAKTVKVRRRKYDAEFKKEVLNMVASGRPVSEVAQSLGIGSNLLYRWISKGKKKELYSTDEATVVFDEEKAALHKRIKELEMERDILKKALSIFSRQIWGAYIVLSVQPKTTTQLWYYARCWVWVIAVITPGVVERAIS